MDQVQSLVGELRSHKLHDVAKKKKKKKQFQERFPTTTSFPYKNLTSVPTKCKQEPPQPREHS